MVDQEISQHRAAEGSDERCHHRVSQGRAPLSQNRKCERFWTLPTYHDPMTTGSGTLSIRFTERCGTAWTAGRTRRYANCRSNGNGRTRIIPSSMRWFGYIVAQQLHGELVTLYRGFLG